MHARNSAAPPWQSSQLREELRRCEGIVLRDETKASGFSAFWRAGRCDAAVHLTDRVLIAAIRFTHSFRVET